jgi:hypothetical protein
MRTHRRRAARRQQEGRAAESAVFNFNLLPDRGFAVKEWPDAHGHVRLRLVREAGDFWDETIWRAIEHLMRVAQSPDEEIRDVVRQAVFHYLAFVAREPPDSKSARRDLTTIEKTAHRLHAAVQRLPSSKSVRRREAREQARTALVLAANRCDPRGGNTFLGQAESLLADLENVAANARRILPSGQRPGPKMKRPGLDRLAWKLRTLLRERCGPKAGAITWDPVRDGYTGDLYQLMALIAPTLPPGSMPQPGSGPGSALGMALRQALRRGARTQFE